jgi:hypothetical protein
MAPLVVPLNRAHLSMAVAMFPLVLPVMKLTALLMLAPLVPASMLFMFSRTALLRSMLSMRRDSGS